MSAPALAAPGGRALTIRGTSYPVLLPTLRDPRLHLAAVIITLQVLGQVAFEFRVSIAQILISLLVCAVLEVGIAFWRQHVLMWPASALITGNGVAFVLRVPGTQHGDWWSLNGWWIFAATAAVSLLSKYVIRAAGTAHLQPVELRARPLLPDPRAGARRAARLLVGADGRVDGRRARRDRRRRTRSSSAACACSHLALAFWLTFAAGIAVLAVSGHAMTARWHVGPITDGYFWWVLVTSPEILVFLFFMITDPKTIPSTPRMRIALRRLGRAARLHPDRARAHRVLEQGRGARLADGRLRRLAAAEALLAAAGDHAHPDRARRRRRTRPVRRRARLRRDPRPQLRDRRTAHVHRPAAGDHDRHVAGRPEQAPRENRAPDRSRPGRRSRAPAARARAPGRQGTRTRGHFRSPARVATAAPGRTRPPPSRPRLPPRPDGRPLRGGQRPGRGDRRCDAWTAHVS